MATSNLRSVQGLSYEQQGLGDSRSSPLPTASAPIAAPVAPLPHHSRGILAVNEARSLGTRASTPLSVPPPNGPVQVNIMQKSRPERRRHSSNSGGVRPKLSHLAATSTLSSRRAHSPNTAAVAAANTAGKPLNTHSPVALAAAAAVTAEKIGRLLLTQGPLAIRHITSHLAQTIPGFGELSLSKQRRLIIAVLDNGDPVKGISFDKIGWGRWAVHEGPVAIKAESGSPALEPVKSGSSNGSWQTRSASLSSREGSRETLLARLLADSDRRASISNQLPNHRLPLSPRLVASASENAIEEDDIELAGEDLYKQGNDEAVFSDDESDDGGMTSGRHDTDEEDWQRIGPAGLRMTSPREQEAIQALVQLRSI